MQNNQDIYDLIKSAISTTLLHDTTEHFYNNRAQQTDIVESLRMTLQANCNKFFEENPNIFDINPEGLNVTHELKWEAGDRILNSIASFVNSPGQTQESIHSRYDTCSESSFSSLEEEPEKPDMFHRILNMIKFTCHNIFETMQLEKEALYGLLIIALITYTIKRDHLSKFIVNFLLGYLVTIMLLEPDSTLNKHLNYITLYEMWQSLFHVDEGDMDDLEMESVSPQGLSEHLPLIISTILSLLTIVTGYTAKKSTVETLFNLTRTSTHQIKNTMSFFLYLANSVSTFF